MKKLDSKPLGWLGSIRSPEDLDREWRGKTLESTLSPVLFQNPVSAGFLQSIEKIVNINTEQIGSLNLKFETLKEPFENK